MVRRRRIDSGHACDRGGGRCTHAREELPIGDWPIPIVVSEVDIPAKTALNELIKDDRFRIILVPEPAVVSGAVTSVDQLRDGRNRVAILAGEQIRADRMKSV